MGLFRSTGRSDVWLPFIGVAAVLTLLGPSGPQASPQDASTQRNTTASAAESVPSQPTVSLDAVRPALTVLAEAMGEDATRSVEARTAIALDEELGKFAHTVDGRAANPSDAEVHEQRRLAAVEARARDDRTLLTRLVSAQRTSPAQTIAFAIALVPDYIDSQSGWMADHILTGLQAGFSRGRFALDRFFLPDWAPPGTTGAATPPRTEHERQPGILLFRSTDPNRTDTPRLYAVLVVLETPTAGPHPRALHSAIGLVREWHAVEHSGRARTPTPISLIGPTFSGSIDPLLAVLRRQHATGPLVVDVFNGSANASDNERIAQEPFVRTYRQLVTDITELMSKALGFLGTRGFQETEVALLVEETSFGRQTERRVAADARKKELRRQIFHFPLHVAQLRTAPSAAPVMPRGLLVAPSLPVDLREPATPTDLLPAVRPGLISPTVEVVFRSLLKAVRQERISTVGILATDTRDTLYLARELRRLTPSVQLVLFGAQALYLHPEYAPFLRGALVSSTYPLNPHLEASAADSRWSFASQEAHGTAEAVAALLAGHTGGVQETRAVWLSVAGSDALWPLVAAQQSSPPPAHRASTATLLLLLSCATFVGAYLCESWRAGRNRGLLAAPARSGWGAFTHAINVVQSGVVVSALTLSVGAVAAVMLETRWPDWWAESVTAVCAVSLLVVLATATAAARALWSVRAEIVAAARAHWMGVRHPDHRRTLLKTSRLSLAVCVGGLLTALTVLTAYYLLTWALVDIVREDATARQIAVARVSSGGMVSPLATVVLVCAALLVPAIWNRLRATPMGVGYDLLAARSPAFQYLYGAAGARDVTLTSLAASLATPLPSLRLRRLVIVLLTAGMLLLVLNRYGLTLDGTAYTRFLKLATFTVILRAALLLLQATQTWRRLAVCLARMKHEPFIAALEAVHRRHISWDVSLFAACVDHLRPIVGLARQLEAHPAVGPVRVAELVSTFTSELASDPKKPLATSTTWAHSWDMVERLVPALRCRAWSPTGEASLVALTGQAPKEHQAVEHGQLLVALHLAFVLRDMVSRVTMTMGNAMVSVALLTLAHLFYAFQGRGVFLLVDLVALAIASAVSLWLLLAVERDFVLSVLRDSKPGHVEFNAGFVRQLGAYVVLPVLAVLGAVFPEIGVHFMGLLDPVRRLVGE